MAVAILEAGVEIDHQRLLQRLVGFGRRHRRGLGHREARREARLGVGREFGCRRLVVEHVGLVPVHLQQPVRGHGGTHTVIVVQDDSSVARADILIGRLHELAACGVPEALDMALGVLGRIADIELVERCAVTLELLQPGHVDLLDAHALVETGSGVLGKLGGFGALRAEAFRLAACHFQAGKMPAHRAVLQRHDLVRQARVDQRLRTDDRARAAGAVHDDQSLGTRREVLHAIDQLGAGAVDAARDRHVVELRHRPRIQDHHVGLGVDQLLQVGGVDARRVVVVLDHFAERLRRHVDAGEDLAARVGPGLQAAFHHGDVTVAHLLQAGGTAVGAAVLAFLAAIHQHDACPGIGQQGENSRLQAG